jgi:hypothetical protein
MSAPIPVDKVEQMFDAYCENQSARYVSSACQVSRPTVQRYIDRGDPARGIQPLAVRLAKLTRHRARVKERRVVYETATMQAASQDQIKDLDELIELATHYCRVEIPKGSIHLLVQLAKTMQMRADLILKLNPFSESEVEHETLIAEFDGKTAAELDYYAIHSRWPSPDDLELHTNPPQSPPIPILPDLPPPNDPIDTELQDDHNPQNHDLPPGAA